MSNVVWMTDTTVSSRLHPESTINPDDFSVHVVVEGDVLDKVCKLVRATQTGRVGNCPCQEGAHLEYNGTINFC